MACHHGYDPDTPVREVIESLMRFAAPRELQPLIFRLTEEVLHSPHIAPHANGRWGDLSNYGDVVAREIGVVVRDASALVASGRQSPPR